MGLIFRDDPHQEPLPRVWGPGLFDNYAGVDARNCYLEYLLDGRGDDGATRLAIETRDIDAYDIQTRVLFWTALASVQMDLGKLSETVKQWALEVLSYGDNSLVADHTEWRDERRQVLESFVTRLKWPQRSSMSDRDVQRYCYELWGDDWSSHTDLESPMGPS